MSIPGSLMQAVALSVPQLAVHMFADSLGRHGAVCSYVGPAASAQACHIIAHSMTVCLQAAELTGDFTNHACAALMPKMERLDHQPVHAAEQLE